MEIVWLLYTRIFFIYISRYYFLLVVIIDIHSLYLISKISVHSFFIIIIHFIYYTKCDRAIKSKLFKIKSIRNDKNRNFFLLHSLLKLLLITFVNLQIILLINIIWYHFIHRFFSIYFDCSNTNI